MDYTLNIVRKCRFFFIFTHSRAPKRSWKIFHEGPGNSWIFLSVQEWEPCKQLTIKISQHSHNIHSPKTVKNVAD